MSRTEMAKIGFLPDYFHAYLDMAWPVPAEVAWVHRLLVRANCKGKAHDYWSLAAHTQAIDAESLSEWPCL